MVESGLADAAAMRSAHACATATALALQARIVSVVKHALSMADIG